MPAHQEAKSGLRRPQALALVFLCTACALAFEVALTRVCSVLLQYHVSFAVVSLAVLGVGLGGFAAYLGTRAHPEREPGVLAAALVGLGPSILLALAVLLRLPFAAHWPLFLFLVLPPFVLAGAFQSLVLRLFASHVGSLYAADLLGGAAGAALAVAGIEFLGGPVNLALLVAMVAALGAAFWVGAVAGTHGRGELRVAAAGALALAGAAVVAQGATGFFAVRYALAPQKLVAQMLRPTSQGAPRLVPELQRWDATSRVDVLELRAAFQEQRLVFIDGETPTAMLRPGGRSPGAAGLDVAEALPALPHRLFAPRQVLCIGSGGGYDVVLALRFGATSVDAVELNAGVLDVVAHSREWSGDIYGRPGVRVHHAEGRQFVESAPAGSYDLVTLVLAQSLAGNLREYALSEYFLYTREAFASYLRALRPEGSLALLVSDERLLRRLLRTAWEALAATQEEPAACVLALSSPHESPYDRLLLVRRQPFDAEARQRIAAEVQQRGYEATFVPAGVAAALGAAPSLAPEAQLPPATDDRPFVFHLEPGMPPALRLLLGIAAVLLAAAVSALRWAGRAVTAAPVERRGALVALALYFACLGLGFLMVEVLVLQRSILVIGYPTLNLAVVLTTFLLAAGAGSAASARFRATPRRHLRWLLFLLAPGLLLLFEGLGQVHELARSWPLAARCMAVAGAVFPFAFCMGMPFPLGIRLLPLRRADMLPWFWGLNGVASILGSALVVAVVLQAGFRAAALVPVAAYLLAGGSTGWLEKGSAGTVRQR